MKQAKMTFQVVFLKDQCSSTPTLMLLNTNRTNKIPCICPTHFTGMGFKNKYFKGTATKTKMSRERPSKKPRNLNLPILEFMYFFISKKSEIRSIRQGGKWPWNGNKDKYKSHGKPSCHYSKLVLAYCSSFGLGRTNGDHGNRK